MEYPLRFVLLGENGLVQESGEATARIAADSLSVLPGPGEAIFISHRDIIDLSAQDYQVELSLTSREKLCLSKLGYQYDSFLRELVRARNELILQDLLMYESLRKSGFKADTVFCDDQGREKQLHACELRLYETALVILPDNGELVRIPYSELAEVKPKEYMLTIDTDYAEKFTFAKMGPQFDPFMRDLSQIMNELSMKVQESLKELLPGLNPLEIRRAAALMKEGKAARRVDLELLSSELWQELESRLALAGIKEEYDYLLPLAQKERVCIGIKRGLMGDLTGEYIWFLMPIYSENPAEPGNAVAIEAASGEGGGRATYFFRIAGRGEYGESKDLAALHRAADDFIRQVNRCMLQINFRREPVYLPGDRLKEPQYEKYRYAVQKLPSLQLLRRHFIGRVFHRSREQWAKDVNDLLEFNVGTSDDDLKWVREGGGR